MFLVILFVFGLLFGSFASVVITRLKSGKKGTLTGRSMCPQCGHILERKDLIPIFSWVFQAGKCRYCGSKIPILYPLLELTMGIVFALCGYFLIESEAVLVGNLFEWLRMIFWLVFAFLSVVYVWYDILYLEIPESILLSLIVLVFVSVSVGMFFPEFSFFTHITVSEAIHTQYAVILILFGILMIASLYAILWCEFSEWIDICILVVLGMGLFGISAFFGTSAFFWSLLGAGGVFVFFFLQIFFSGGKWMGGGDLRIAILLGLVAGPFTVVATVSSYIAGSVIGIVTLIILRLKGQKNLRNIQIPFGPFLAIGIFAVLFWGEILQRLFFPMG